VNEHTVMRVMQPRRNRQVILGVKFDLIGSADAHLTIEAWRQRRERHYITFSNPYVAVLCRRDEETAVALGRAGLTLPDGAGIVLAARLLGCHSLRRVTGPTFMLEICDWGRERGYRHFFYGGKEGVANTLAERLCQQFPGLEVAGTYSPPFRTLTQEEDEAAVRMINATRPDVVWVGLGAPKQEKWMAAHVGRIEAAAMIGVGAAFDFHSGNVKWAPAWVRRIGMEWSWRLAHEPRRLWRRNLDSPLFLLAVLRQRILMMLGRSR